MDDSKKFLVIAIPCGFIAFMLLISLFTGTNPIENLFLLVGQILLYLGGLIIFGTPVFLLVSFMAMVWGEETKISDEYEDADTRLGETREVPAHKEPVARKAAQSASAATEN